MPNAKPRTIRLELPPDARGVGAFSITSGRRTHFYAFREIPCEIGGRGFEVHKLGVGAMYHVRVGEPPHTSCECLGFLRHDHCKHTEGLAALIRARRI